MRAVIKLTLRHVLRGLVIILTNSIPSAALFCGNWAIYTVYCLVCIVQLKKWTVLLLTPWVRSVYSVQFYIYSDRVRVHSTISLPQTRNILLEEYGYNLHAPQSTRTPLHAHAIMHARWTWYHTGGSKYVPESVSITMPRNTESFKTE